MTASQPLVSVYYVTPLRITVGQDCPSCVRPQRNRAFLFRTLDKLPRLGYTGRYHLLLPWPEVRPAVPLRRELILFLTSSGAPLLQSDSDKAPLSRPPSVPLRGLSWTTRMVLTLLNGPCSGTASTSVAALGAAAVPCSSPPATRLLRLLYCASGHGRFADAARPASPRPVALCCFQGKRPRRLPQRARPCWRPGSVRLFDKPSPPREVVQTLGAKLVHASLTTFSISPVSSGERGFVGSRRGARRNFPSTRRRCGVAPPHRSVASIKMRAAPSERPVSEPLRPP